MPSHTGLLRTKALTPAIGATVEGIDLSAPLSDDAATQIRTALDDHLVLFFEGQSLTPVQQRDFAALFGPLYLHPFYPGHETATEVMVLEHDATHRANSDRWHNDVTYLERPPQAAVLYAEEIPEIGGDTLWANMYLAYETLSEPIRQLVSQLRAVHSFAKNFTPERFKALGIEDRRDRMYAEHPPGFRIRLRARTPRRDARRSSLTKTSRRTSRVSHRARATRCCACSSNIWRGRSFRFAGVGGKAPSHSGIIAGRSIAR